MERRRPTSRTTTPSGDELGFVPGTEPHRNAKAPQQRLRSFAQPLLLAIFLVTSLRITLHPPSVATLSNHRGGRQYASINDACRGYQGILHIAQGDQEGAAGTIFFLFIVNQLLYAHEHNLIPWIHLNNASHHIYDPVVHGDRGSFQTVRVRDTVHAAWSGFRDPIADKHFRFPGPPKWNHTHDDAVVSTIRLQPVTVSGTGVWKSYFEPVSAFSPNDPSCQQLPMVRLSYSQIIPGLHLYCPWAVRAWRYGGMPPTLRRNDVSYDEWFHPMRQRGGQIVQQYFRFRPYLLQSAHRANPSSTHCLAMHVRHSDKANRRQKIPLSQFLPYVDAYLKQVPSGTVYLATDSSKVLQQLQATTQYRGRLNWQDEALRSNDTTAVFRMTGGHHETNIQVLVDILAMSKCEFLLHGLSAVSEAALYLQPTLQGNGHSVNLELPKHASVHDFQRVLQREYGIPSNAN